ncbi:hypothetical protein GCM10019059_37960 [Camelimonas fluminis]|uniref:Uncharacterized protein n=1 Tax=Camelimonas fluminis TaxID=1576911 RepID=A0ABV7UBS0_9HYPH|nr:hypothetical protein [Camelimonas fluminis]GHE74888.1 hypothetical protein GCM10019059_37960 [Camelimonas fluminis]
MTIIYLIPDDLAQRPHYAERKDEACARARFLAELTGRAMDVEMHETANLPERELAIALLKNENWSGKSRVIYTARPRNRFAETITDPQNGPPDRYDSDRPPERN